MDQQLEKKARAAFQDRGFVDSFLCTRTAEDAVALFASRGMEVEAGDLEQFNEFTQGEELTEADLTHVIGGISMDRVRLGRALVEAARHAAPLIGPRLPLWLRNMRRV